MPKVTKEQIIEDIFQTEKELKAYSLLQQGYSMLMDLPENQEPKTLAVLRYEERRNFNNQRECEDFLKTLYKLKNNVDVNNDDEYHEYNDKDCVVL